MDTAKVPKPFPSKGTPEQLRIFIHIAHLRVAIEPSRRNN
jgi:hypothetical protein